MFEKGFTDTPKKYTIFFKNFPRGIELKSCNAEIVSFLPQQLVELFAKN